jgi:Mrp family chromosome partitioning ATPase
MSSFDQAFVQAFARRSRSSQGRPRQAAGNAPTAKQASGTSTPNAPSESADIDSASPESMSYLDQGSLTVDASVAGTAQIWVDPIEDQIARGDVADTSVPKPHVEPQVPHASANQMDPASSLQHIHTAYATSFTEADPGIAVPPSTSSPGRPVAIPEIDEKAAEERKPIPQPSTNQVASEITEIRIDTPAEPRSAIDEVNQTLDTVEEQLVAAQQPNAAETLTPFQAAWEVDVFDVPSTVADLFFEGSLFQQVAERMAEAVDSGLKTVLITSNASGEGRSTAAIGIAMAAAAAGVKVALVDADTENPTLADDLRIELQSGWAEAVREGMPIKEVAIHAVEDGVTLIPLNPPNAGGAATPFEVIQLIDLLQSKFELILIDGPSGVSANLHQCASVVDSAVIVRDVTRTSSVAVAEFSIRLRESGVQGVGVVENFA